MAKDDTNAGTIHPLYLLIAVVILALVFLVFAAFGSMFLNSIPNPFAYGTEGNAIYQNASLAKSVLNVGTSAIAEGMIGALIMGAVLGIAVAYWKPSKGLGIMSIVLLFVLPFLWYILSVALSPTNFGWLLGVVPSSATTLYNFVFSYYYVAILEVSLAFSIILHFRRADTEENFTTDNSPVMAGGDRYTNDSNG